MTKPVRLLVSPRGDSILKIARDHITSGNIWVISISATMAYLPRETGTATERNPPETTHRHGDRGRARHDQAVLEEGGKALFSMTKR